MSKRKLFSPSWLFLGLIFLLFLPLIDLFHSGLPITHDGQEHVARIANFYQNLSEGIVIPRWAPNLNWGYGHPILMFLYPFPSYLASFFHVLGFSFIDSTKVVFGLLYIASGITMYIWIREILGEKAGFIASMLYTFAPYRFVDLYVRGAIGEHAAFVFPPLIFYFLTKISKENKSLPFVGASLSFTLFILSHNAISLMFLPVIAFYIAYVSYFSKARKKTFFLSVFSILLGFGLSAFFWLPAFSEGKYTLREIVTKGEYASRFSELPKFLFGEWSYGISGQFTVQLGIVHWIAVLCSFFILIKQRRKEMLWLTGFFLLFLFGSFFLMTPFSAVVWEKITILQKFQFPWRFLSLAVFACAVLSAVVINRLQKSIAWQIIISLALVILFVNKDYWHVNGYLAKSDSFFSSVYYGTTDTGESAPIWSIRFMLQTPKARAEVIGGSADIKELKRTTTSHTYRITARNSARIRENTLYFPGWIVRVDGKKTDIQFQDANNRGLITFFVPQGDHRVDIHFGETKLRLVADVLTVLSITIIAALFVFWKKMPFSA